MDNDEIGIGDEGVELKLCFQGFSLGHLFIGYGLGQMEVLGGLMKAILLSHTCHCLCLNISESLPYSLLYQTVPSPSGQVLLFLKESGQIGTDLLLTQSHFLNSHPNLLPTSYHSLSLHCSQLPVLGL
jgi:hypothetical protein